MRFSFLFDLFEFSRSQKTQFLTYPPTKISSTRANHSHKQARQNKGKFLEEKKNITKRKKMRWTNDRWRKIPFLLFFFLFKGLIKNKIYFPETRLQMFEVILHYWWIKPKPSEPCVPFIFLSFVKKKRRKIPKVVFVKLETFCQTGIGERDDLLFEPFLPFS